LMLSVSHIRNKINTTIYFPWIKKFKNKKVT
jgi:hypothetical protein